jgi:hypothetical protein
MQPPVTGEEKSISAGVSSLVQGVQQRFKSFLSRSKVDTQVAAKQKQPNSAQEFTYVAFQPKDSSWARCIWKISKADQQRASNLKATCLCLRVVDLCNSADALISAHAIKEIVVDLQANEWFLPVPMDDREYLLELGYHLPKGGWFSLAFSDPVHVPKCVPTEINPIPSFSTPSREEVAQTLSNKKALPVTEADIYEQIYQQAVTTNSTPRVGSESFQEHVHSDHNRNSRVNDSGAGSFSTFDQESLRSPREARQNDPDNQPDSDWF